MSKHDDLGESMVRGIGHRSAALRGALDAATDDMDVVLGLPDRVAPGRLAFTYMVKLWDHVQAQDIAFDWDGGSVATWTHDLSEHEAVTPGSGAVATGWASWLNGVDLLLAWQWPDVEVEGWARVRGGAPSADDEGDDPEAALADPQRWLRLARTITDVICEQDVPAADISRYQWGEEAP